MEVFFYNWTDHDFTYNWGGKPYKFDAGKVYRELIYSTDGQTKIILEPAIARHFAKHLADDHFNRHGIGPDHRGLAKKSDVFLDPQNISLQEEFLMRGLTLPEVVKEPVEAAEEVAPIEAPVVMTEPVLEAPKKKAGRPKTKVEEKFVGIE